MGVVQRLNPFAGPAEFALIRRSGRDSPAKVAGYEREKSPREVELEEDLPGGVYVLQEIDSGGRFGSVKWQEELFGGPASSSTNSSSNSGLDEGDLRELIEEAAGSGDGITLPDPPEAGSNREWLTQVMVLNPNLMSQQFAPAAKEIASAAGDGFFGRVEDQQPAPRAQAQPTSQEPAPEADVDDQDDDTITDTEDVLVDLDEDQDDAGEDDGPVCGFPTKDGGECSREVDEPGERCHQHADADDLDRVEAEAAAAESIDEYPDAAAAQEAVADGGEEL